MKKSTLFLGLLVTAGLFLSACNNSKDYTMSFEDAVDTANHSALQTILTENENFEQTFNVVTNFDTEGTKVNANISASSKQNLSNKNSESSTSFGANITSEGETTKIDGTLDLRLLDDTIYLNLSSLNLTGSEDLAMIAMMTEGFKNQWFMIPMSGLSDMPDTFSILKDSKDLNKQAKEIIVNEGSTIYSGKFTEFNGYNAWRFSLDNEKLNSLIKKYYDIIDDMEDDIEEETDIPEMNIKNFEGYLIITGKDKVTTVIENMDMVEGDTTLNVNGFGGENYMLTISLGNESILTLIANKKNSNYEISLDMENEAKLEGTISPKLSKSNIDIKFDVVLTVKSEDDETDDTTIPAKGNRSYNAIPEFSIVAPEDAQDLTEVLQSYLGGMFGDSDYSDYEDYDYEDYEDVENNLEEDME